MVLTKGPQHSLAIDAGPLYPQLRIANDQTAGILEMRQDSYCNSVVRLKSSAKARAQVQTTPHIHRQMADERSYSFPQA